MKFIGQQDSMDCGAASLSMVARYHGISVPIAHARVLTNPGRQGVSLAGLSRAAEALGFRTVRARVSLRTLADQAPLPLIAHWEGNHFVVVYGTKRGRVLVADPARGRLTMTAEEFERGWASQVGSDGKTGVILLLEPSLEQPDSFGTDAPSWGNGLQTIWPYVKTHRGLLAQVGLGALVMALLQLAAPFLTQALVDLGIANRDLGLIWTIAAAQVFIFVSVRAVGALRDWIFLYVGTHAKTSLSSLFIGKITALPLKFFDARTIGDIEQRVDDHDRLERFITSTSTDTISIVVKVVVFGSVLLWYSPLLLSIFAVGATAYVVYVSVFLARRRALDHTKFSVMSQARNRLIEVVEGMPELKVADAGRSQRWAWESIHAKGYRVDGRLLAVDQLQQNGGSFIIEGTSILITVVAATMVVKGSLTLGMLLATQYLVVQLATSLNTAIAVVRSAQDTRIAVERLAEVHDSESEGGAEGALPPAAQDIHLDSVSFSYGGDETPLAVDGLSFHLKAGSVTALVGASGSGKTTMLKLLLRFYEPNSGDIRLGGTPLHAYDLAEWRAKCGVVLQDGHVFDDTISANVALGAEHVDASRVADALSVACLGDFVNSLPRGLQTRVGRGGVGMSKGQQQRLLIARAIYKNPDYLFLDEATSALDAETERAIVSNLDAFYRGRTVLVIAHRLSTVRAADHIVVVEDGTAVERGTHHDLVSTRGRYYALVRNQLDLDAA